MGAVGKQTVGRLETSAATLEFGASFLVLTAIDRRRPMPCSLSTRSVSASSVVVRRETIFLVAGLSSVCSHTRTLASAGRRESCWSSGGSWVDHVALEGSSARGLESSFGVVPSCRRDCEQEAEEGEEEDEEDEEEEEEEKEEDENEWDEEEEEEEKETSLKELVVVDVQAAEHLVVEMSVLQVDAHSRSDFLVWWAAEGENRTEVEVH
ncbi:uncharacterized protein BO97DRAFT_425089 [Aspergillus homomorphus CBS 101889]|uniref:Uncharacterized protein n=1 Tax=Aspergillus homomorphus (strain CBS 101889) TaxID=1450537 RepID=A0A395HVG5_ASPHC|nr:hypothetical protein BO97DRAFT_425089 [Aspergillus homomorphus CBS 101889]RAL11790.1 hypothetical protein BO97DRAFT_425089 [Aspergillus homomorphus CBS 101889]